jgi:hypothetical protein
MGSCVNRCGGSPVQVATQAMVLDGQPDCTFRPGHLGILKLLLGDGKGGAKGQRQCRMMCVQLTLIRNASHQSLKAAGA